MTTRPVYFGQYLLTLFYVHHSNFHDCQSSYFIITLKGVNSSQTWCIITKKFPDSTWSLICSILCGHKTKHSKNVEMSGSLPMILSNHQLQSVRRGGFSGHNNCHLTAELSPCDTVLTPWVKLSCTGKKILQHRSPPGVSQRMKTLAEVMSHAGNEISPDAAHCVLNIVMVLAKCLPQPQMVWLWSLPEILNSIPLP